MFCGGFIAILDRSVRVLLEVFRRLGVWDEVGGGAGAGEVVRKTSTRTMKDSNNKRVMVVLGGAIAWHVKTEKNEFETRRMAYKSTTFLSKAKRARNIISPPLAPQRCRLTRPGDAHRLGRLTPKKVKFVAACVSPDGDAVFVASAHVHSSHSPQGPTSLSSRDEF